MIQVFLLNLRRSMAVLTIFQACIHLLLDGPLSASLLSACSFVIFVHHSARASLEPQWSHEPKKHGGLMKTFASTFSTTLLSLIRVFILSQIKENDSYGDWRTFNLFINYIVLLIAFTDNWSQLSMENCVQNQPRPVLRRVRRAAPAG